jgi:hypothetical protein
MISNTVFTLADIESRISISNGQWQHFSMTRWSLMQNLDGFLHVALDIESDAFEQDFTWEAIGITAEITNSFDANQINLQIRTSDLNSSEMLSYLLLNFLKTQENDPHAVINFLEMRRYLWGRPVIDSLSDTQAQGLFGELYFIQNLLNDPASEIIPFWDGPDGSLNDFNWTNLGIHIEVKTSSRIVQPLTHKISSLNQLNIQEGHSLFLFSMSARIDAGGEWTLNTLIDEITAELMNSGDYDTLQNFNDKLIDYGWNPLQDDFNFIVNEDWAEIYSVVEGFPRIIPSDLNDIIDQRIDVGAYDITMTGLDNVRVDFGEELSITFLQNLHNNNDSPSA